MANVGVKDSEMPSFLRCDSEMAKLIADFDWSTTELGPISTWPRSLCSIIAVIMHSPLPSAILWGDRGLMLYNDGYLKLAGAGHPRILGLPVREAWPELAEFNDQVMKVGLAGGALTYQDHKMRLDRSGSPEDHWMDLAYSPIFGDDDQPAGVLALVADTTKNVRAETELRATAARLAEINDKLEARALDRTEALASSQTQFRLLVQGVTDYAIYMLDVTGKVTSWNTGAERIKGYLPHEVIGRNFSSFYEEKDRVSGEPQRALEIARREGSFTAEGWRIRKDGSRFRASVVIDAIYDDAGMLIGFAKITRDVTEREQAQQELELAREALFQSQKLEAIGHLTGGIAHDFNNLLMAIRSGLELLRKSPKSAAQTVKLLDNCLKATDRGAALTQRMLAFARRQELATERVVLPQLVGSMTELLQRALGPTFLIETRFPGDLVAVNADVNQLEMAVLNLAVNARDAMPEGGTIAISAHEQKVGLGDVPDLAPGGYVRLTVTDNGSGMSADTLARAADPFFTTKGIGKGTGLGLSMVHGFAQQLGGALQLESRVGEGTSAHIWLPLAETGSAAEQPNAAAAPAESESRYTILVVDDDAIILMNTAALLEDLGHEVIEASSGEEALEVMRSRSDIELLITDQAMPGMTGGELIGVMRTQWPEVSIILATGYGETPSDLGQNFLRLAKPFGQIELARAVATSMS